MDQLVGAGYQQRSSDWHVVADLIVQLARKAFGLFTDFLSVQLSPEQARQLQEREAARRRRDYEQADGIRDQFRASGLAIEDTPDGPVVLPNR